MDPRPDVPFSMEAVREGYWAIYHDDDCGAELTPDGKCPRCNFVPDMQSLGARRTPKHPRYLLRMNGAA